MTTSKRTELSDKELRAVHDAMGFPEVEPHRTAADAARSARTEASAALKAANRAANRNDLAAAKQWTEIAKRLSDAYEKLANAPAPQPPWEQDEQVMDDLRDRLTKLFEHEGELQRWLWRKEIWDEMAAEATRTGAPMPAPMPPRPHHWTDDLPEDIRKKVAWSGG